MKPGIGVVVPYFDWRKQTWVLKNDTWREVYTDFVTFENATVGKAAPVQQIAVDNVASTSAKSGCHQRPAATSPPLWPAHQGAVLRSTQPIAWRILRSLRRLRGRRRAHFRSSVTSRAVRMSCS